MKLRIFFGGQFPSSEYDDGNVGQPVVVADLVQHLEPAHVGQPQVQHHAIAGVIAQRRERAGAGIGNDDLDVVVVEELPDA